MTPADLRPSRPAGPPLLPVARVADLQLRGRAAPVATRVYWPEPCTAGQRSSVTTTGTATTTSTGVARRTALVLLVAGTDAAGRTDALARGLCTYAGVVVLSLLRPTGAVAPGTDAGAGADHQPEPDRQVGGDIDTSALRDAATALDWAADHAAELGADPGRLVVAGWASGAGLAAAVAHRATQQGWPPVARQLLVCPEPTVALGPGPLAGVAPATVVTTGRADSAIAGAGGDGVGCGAWLRSAGVRVDELRYEGLPAGEPGWTPWTGAADRVMADLARSLQHRLGLPPTAATRFVVPEDPEDREGSDENDDDENDDGHAGANAGGTRRTGGGFV